MFHPETSPHPGASRADGVHDGADRGRHALGWHLLRLGAGASFLDVETETFTLLAICQWFNVLNCRPGRLRPAHLAS
jgi:hypothetical protein